MRALKVLARTLALTVLLTTVAVLAEPGRASASTPLRALADVWVASLTGSSVRVCAEGWVDDGESRQPEWTFTVVGPTAPPYYYERPLNVLPEVCWSFYPSKVPAGTTQATLTFTGAGEDVFALCTLTVAWAPGAPPHEDAGGCTTSSADQP